MQIKKKKAKVILLPSINSRNALRGYTDKSLLFDYQNQYTVIKGEEDITSHFHLYIITDDLIRDGDWYTNGNHLYQAKMNYVKAQNDKKVIATTDKSLVQLIKVKEDHTDPVKFHLPKPSDEFIQSYIKAYNSGNPIVDVLVELQDNGEEDWIGDNENGEPFWNEKWEIKINKNSEISISKVKDSWSREKGITLYKTQVQ